MSTCEAMLLVMVAGWMVTAVLVWAFIATTSREQRRQDREARRGVRRRQYRD